MTHNKRVTVVDGWCVTDNEDGSQTRARLEVDQAPSEPERGEGMWNAGVSLVREYPDSYYADIDSHDGLAAVMDRVDKVGGSWVVYAGDYDGKDTILGSDDKMEEFVSRYLRIFWNVQYAKRFYVGDYRYSYPVWGIAEGVEEEGTDIPALVAETHRQYEAYANGDVYVVISEHRTLADAMEDEEFSWSEHDYPCGGYYGDSEGRYGVAEALGVDVDDVPENVYDYISTNY